MATFIPFHCFTEDLAHGVHNLGSHTLKVMLSNTAPDAAADTVDGDITEITAQDGYSAGGATVTVTASGQTAGVYETEADDVVFTPDNPGSFGPLQYCILYNSTAGSAGNRPLIGYWDRGSATTPTDGVPLTLSLPSYVLRIAAG